MKAIETKYLPPTNSRGARIKAWTEGGNSITIGYPYELSRDDVHHAAATALCKKMDWPTKLAGGSLSHGRYCFVIIK